jgi:hypothetical protein
LATISPRGCDEEINSGTDDGTGSNGFSAGSAGAKHVGAFQVCRIQKEVT